MRTNSTREREPSPFTQRVYSQHWDVFRKWCEAAGQPEDEREGRTIRAFLLEKAKRNRLSSVMLSATAIRYRHQRNGSLTKTLSDAIRQTMLEVRRRKKSEGDRPARASSAIPGRADINRLLLVAWVRRRSGRGLESEAQRDRRAAVDCALIALSVGPGLRRTEIARLRWDDIRETGPETVRIGGHRSGLNPAPQGVTVHGRLARALLDLRDRPDRDGERVAGLSSHQIHQRILRLGAHAGIANLRSNSGWLKHRSRKAERGDA